MEELNVETTTQENVVDSQPVEQVEVTESEHVEVTPTQETETDSTKPVQSKEENARYAEIRRKYEAEKAEAIQKEKDRLISEMYGESHGIHTEAEYKKAIEQVKQQAEIEKIKAEKSYTDEEAKEILEARQIKADKEKADQEAKAKSEQEAKAQADNQMFLDYFHEENGRPFSDKDIISQEVWDKVSQGVPLKYAYIEYQHKQLKEGQAVLKKNQENAQANVGSIKGDGVVDSNYISFETFEANKHDQRWVIKNLTKINESRAKW